MFEAQVKNPGENDWILDVRKNLEKLEIFLDFDQIKTATSQQFRTMVDKFINEKCFEDLIEEKNTKNKVKHIQYDKHEIQKYLAPGDISNTQAKQIFLLRSRMLTTKDNFKNNFQDDLCPLCSDTSKDSQEHVMNCPAIRNNRLVIAGEVKYENLFVNDVKRQVQVTNIICENFQKRKKVLKKKW